MLKKILSLILNYDSQYRTRTTRRVVERRVPRYESSRQTEHRIADEWTEESSSELVDASDAQRLEEEEGYYDPRTTQRAVEHEGVLPEEQRPRNLIPDPWENHYDDQIEKREG
tara:strand:- start:1073 stop:1411 length:339 start_codon:yes stop_codon:yes gene_type:complete